MHDFVDVSVNTGASGGENRGEILKVGIGQSFLPARAKTDTFCEAGAVPQLLSGEAKADHVQGQGITHPAVLPVKHNIITALRHDTMLVGDRRIVVGKNQFPIILTGWRRIDPEASVLQPAG